MSPTANTHRGNESRVTTSAGSCRLLIRPPTRCVGLLLLVLAVALSGCATGRAYREKLSAGADYAHERPPFDVTFAYTTKDAPQLAALRERFALDRIAGEGTEIERAFRLLEWAHEIVPWDGSAPWPETVLSAENIIDWSQAHETGVNCRMKAIMLQEALLAVGIPARMVSCVPLDPEDRDSHVINAVWSREEQRWVWMDPSFYAWPLGADGTILGIREVRRMLAGGERPNLNSEAELRGKPICADWYFGTYMMKNLYALISPLDVRPGYEGSPGEKRRVILVPAIVLPPDPQNRTRTWRSSGATWTEVAISNPDIFWAVP